MAETETKTTAGKLMRTFWSVLVLLCIGLLAAHLVAAMRSSEGPEMDVIDQTFTTGSGRR